MKIIAIGWNYQAHNAEMKREVTEPTVFMKPDSALLKANKPFFIPDFTDNIEYEAEIVIKIDRLGKHIAERFAHRYYSEVTIGVDFTARQLQQQLRNAGSPWEMAKAFDNSAAIGEFIPVSQFDNINALNFGLDLNGTRVQSGNTADMIYSIDKIIAYVSRFFTLKIGDLIFTGTPVGVGPVAIGDRLEGYIEQQKLFDFYVK